MKTRDLQGCRIPTSQFQVTRVHLCVFSGRDGLYEEPLCLWIPKNHYNRKTDSEYERGVSKTTNLCRSPLISTEFTAPGMDHDCRGVYYRGIAPLSLVDQIEPVQFWCAPLIDSYQYFRKDSSVVGAFLTRSAYIRVFIDTVSYVQVTILLISIHDRCFRRDHPFIPGGSYEQLRSKRSKASFAE
ncbi:hypothetical protein PROFUN_12666 [Planoprotostelium fungivorum]|uniref:Uncharacterized protein n=1 Tax=Planoprotostelium fungivorum TaxID=1890364 RepID=A0A2P6N6Z9_9EUKA|nr:hypothetical protein PROFUN_12666 [Planoprotostelium fungivorum]